MTGGDSRVLRVLTSLESRPTLTQRMLARQLEVALGTTNNLIRSLLAKKLIRRSSRDGRTLYSLTARGLNEKERLMRRHFHLTLEHYTDIRNRISSSLVNLCRNRRKLVFYGAGDVAQIVYVVVANSPFELVGVVDDHRVGQQFFHHRVEDPAHLSESGLGGRPFDVLVVASFRHAREIRERLVVRGFPPSRMLTLLGEAGLKG